MLGQLGGRLATRGHVLALGDEALYLLPLAVQLLLLILGARTTRPSPVCHLDSILERSPAHTHTT